MKKKVIGLFLFLIIIVVVCIGGMMFFKTTKTLSFQQGNGLIDNPMQGFYIQLDTSEPGRMEKFFEKGVHLVLLAYNLNGFQEKPLDEAKLQELRSALETARKNKVQVIFRAAYGFSEGMQTKEPDSLETVSGHIGQIAAVLNEYSEILVCVQAGMLGPWGEWHSSSFFIDQQVEVKVHNQVAGWWNQTLSEAIQLQLRTPHYIRDAVKAGVPLERLGFHNDAIISTESDMGTYVGSDQARQEELTWLAKNLGHSRTGGEAPQVSAYAAAEQAIPEFARLGLTYLNLMYNKDVISSWESQSYQGENALEYIKKHFGSRLHLSEVKLPARVTEVLNKNRIRMVLQNTGFAEVRKDLQYFLVMQQGETVVYQALDLNEGNKGSVLLQGKISFLRLEKEQRVQLGIWTGYGRPGEGLVYVLANEEAGITGDVYFFAEFEYHYGYWGLVE